MTTYSSKKSVVNDDDKTVIKQTCAIDMERHGATKPEVTVSRTMTNYVQIPTAKSKFLIGICDELDKSAIK